MSTRKAVPRARRSMRSATSPIACSSRRSRFAKAQAFADTVFGNKPTKVDYSCIPSAVFSHPPLAGVGMTEGEARNQLGAVKVYTADFRPMKNVLAARNERALYKIVVDAASDKIVGAHMIGPDAPEILQMLAVAVKAGLRKSQFDEVRRDSSHHGGGAGAAEIVDRHGRRKCWQCMEQLPVGLTQSGYKSLAFSSSMRAWARKGDGMRICIVHNDSSIRTSLRTLAAAAQCRIDSFHDAASFLAQLPISEPACLILGTDLPDIDGLQLQSLLASRPDLPVIFVADRPSVRTVVQAMKAGAMEVFTTPVDESSLLGAIRQGLQRSAAVRAQDAERRALEHKYARLSRREREVMQLVIRGRLNKHIAAELGISEITVKTHRGKVMRKMQADSVPHLVNMSNVVSALTA